MNESHLRASRTYDHVNLTYYQHVNGGGVNVAISMTLDCGKEENDYWEPFTHITMTMAQELMDDLWRCGVRPTDGAGTAGSMRAVERHLQDMRVLAFRSMPEVEMPK